MHISNPHTEALQKQKVDTPTIIGVVGNTGAGKSSVINAMLEEERLVPTNCMRACTAVVTELSWNSSQDPKCKYRAEIDFIKAADWQKDLELSFDEMLDSNGEVSRECSNEDSEAGIAYAKIKAGRYCPLFLLSTLLNHC
jgi:ATPase subunit of ABC transporter with duplicated ATPase domains